MSFWEEDQQEQQSFFGGGAREQATPLANRLRPQDLSEFSGQTHLLGEGKVLRQLIDQDQISSMIFWGPPRWNPPPPTALWSWLWSTRRRNLSMCWL